MEEAGKAARFSSQLALAYEDGQPNTLTLSGFAFSELWKS
jgi:hypothetical protein